MIYVDSNVFIYAVGRPPPLCGPRRRIFSSRLGNEGKSWLHQRRRRKSFCMSIFPRGVSKHLIRPWNRLSEGRTRSFPSKPNARCMPADWRTATRSCPRGTGSTLLYANQEDQGGFRRCGVESTRDSVDFTNRSMVSISRRQVRLSQSNDSNSSRVIRACLSICASVDRLTGLCAGTVSLSTSTRVCLCRRIWLPFWRMMTHPSR